MYLVGMKMRGYLFGDDRKYKNYRHMMESAGGTLQFGGSAKNCDLLILPGGGDIEPWRYGKNNCGSCHFDPALDAAELELLSYFVQTEKPVLGICRGLQIINVFFGGTLIQDISGHNAVDGIDRCHTVLTEDWSMRRLWGDTMIVNSAHHQAIDRVGRGLNVIQRTPDRNIEAIRHERLPIWAVQWHPERLNEKIGEGLLRFCLCL